MRNTVLWSIILFLASYALAKAESSELVLSDWQVHSAYSDVNCLVVDDNDRLWSGSNGGIVVADMAALNSEPNYLGIFSGMTNLEITALVYSKEYDLVISGSADGTLQLFSDDYTCESISDIKRSGFANPAITDIKVFGKYLYISGGFGLTVFDMNKKIFTETITKIADYSRFTTINQILLHNNQIYVATHEGIAKAQLNTFIQNPINWTAIVANINEIKKTYKASKLLSIKDDIYAVSDTSIMKLVNDTFQIIAQYPNYSVIASILNIRDSLYITDQFNISKINSDRLPLNHPLYDERSTNISTAIVLADTPNLRLAFGYKENGVGISSDNQVTLIKINSPLKRAYREMDVDGFGNLWLATGNGTAARGLAILDNKGKWVNANANNNKSITSNAYYDVYSAPNGKTYLGNWGGGLSEVEYSANSELLVTNYDTKNSPLTAFQGNPNSSYTMGAGIKMDSKQNLYFLNVFAMAGMPVIIKRTIAGEFSTITPPSTVSGYFMTNLEIDNYNTLWLSSPKDGGLLYINEDKQLYGNITRSGTNLLSNTINSIAFDHQGYLWIGTDQGLNMIVNSSSVLGSTAPIIRKINALAGKPINDIYIDAIDNKWIATNEGIYVISADGTEIIANLNSKNSPLQSNVILSITSNKINGRMYFASASNLFSASSLSVQPLSEYSISCYPQPFNPNMDNELTIDGLAKDNILKIVTTEGRFVRSINAAGGRAIWDGKDDKGKSVQTGIYLILASSEAGDEKAVGKVAVKVR